MSFFFTYHIFLSVVQKKYDFPIICCQYPILTSFSLVHIVRPTGKGAWLHHCVTTTLICSGGFTNRLSRLKRGTTDLRGGKFESKTISYGN